MKNSFKIWSLLFGLLFYSSIAFAGFIAQPGAGGGGSGDIDSVVAGSGLTGGATSGDATVNVGVTSPITVGADAVACPTCTTNASALTSNLPVIGAGSNATAVGTRSGNTTEFATVTGTKTVSKQLAFDASGNVIASATDIGAGSITDHTHQSAGAQGGTLDAAAIAAGTIAAARLPAGSTTQSGIAEAAIASEVTTGTDTARYVTPAALAGSTIFGRKVVQIPVIDFTTAITTGDGKWYFVIPPELNGMNFVAVSAQVITVSSSGAINVDITRCNTVATGNACTGTVLDVLTTNITIDANEQKSSTAAVPAVIDTGNDSVATDHVIRIDVDGAGTDAQGLIVTMEFQLP